jgi:hypothetical protein
LGRLEQLESRDLLTWSALANPIPNSDTAGTMLLLPNGTVMVQGGGQTSAWYDLAPDSTGSYVNGTWTQLASMNVSRQYFGSNVLSNDKVFVVGGEYAGDVRLTASAEIYDMATNTWTTTASAPNGSFGDDPTEVLNDGTILAGYIFGPQTNIYDPTTGAWSAGPTKLRNDRSDEEGWVKLANGNILSYDVFASINSGTSTSQMYNPSLNEWIDAGTLPVMLSSSADDYELGPGMLLPDGRVFWIGANGNTALYTPGPTATDAGTWDAGPVVPRGRGADDAPAVVLPDGQVLVAADTPKFKGPTAIYDYNPATNKIVTVSVPSFIYEDCPAYVDRMLVLPNGQVLYSNGASSTLYVDNGGAPKAAWQPTISSIASDGGATYTLTGTQTNGLSEGAAYGDDAEMAENYPIVRLRASNGTITYATTSDWSTSGVATGTTPETTLFTLPPGLANATYALTVIADGMASKAFLFKLKIGT